MNIVICCSCEYCEETRWGLLCRRLARQDTDGDVDDLYVDYEDFCSWGVKKEGVTLNAYLLLVDEENFVAQLICDDPYILTSEGEKRLADMTMEEIKEALITKGGGKK